MPTKRRYTKPRPDITPAYFDVAEAAKYLNVSQKTVRRLINSGELTGYRYGPRVLRVKISDLDAIYTAS